MSDTLINYHIEFEYDGTEFNGYQIQNNVRTIQGELQFALNKIFHQDIHVVSAGRTDAGVHAYAQSACFHAPDIMPCENLKRALNSNLPDDIAIKSCDIKPMNFHPRFNAIYKIYRYRFHTGYVRKAIDRNLSFHHRGKLDINKLKEAIKLFEGKHDFAAFACIRGDETGNEDTTRTIYEISLLELPDNTYEIHFKGEGFLYKMVRMITGTMLHYASNNYSIKEVEKYFVSPQRASAGPAVPGHGLALVKVGY